MTSGEQAMAELLINTILIMGIAAAIGAAIAVMWRGARAVMRLRAAIRAELDPADPGERPHGYF